MEENFNLYDWNNNRRLAESINCNDIKTSLLYGKSI